MEKAIVKATVGFAGKQTMSAGEERVVDREEYSELLKVGYVIETGIVEVSSEPKAANEPKKKKSSEK